LRRAYLGVAVAAVAIILFVYFAPVLPVSLPYIDITVKESNSLTCAILGMGGSYVTIMSSHPAGFQYSYYSIGWGCTPLRQIVNSTCAWIPPDSLERSVKFCSP